MARFLFCWELGGGWGHVLPHLALLRGLQARGHAVLFAARDVDAAGRVLGKYSIPVVQAPIPLRGSRRPIAEPSTYAHILHNVGYDDSDLVTSLLRAWRNFFDLVAPDTVFFDHAPTARLAARGHGFQQILIGSGFAIPPDVYPLPSLRFWQPYQNHCRDDEEGVLRSTNTALAAVGLPEIERLGELGSADRVVLQTLKELDHYPARPATKYWGPPPTPPGEAPVWPDAPGPKVFAYLKPFAGLDALLLALQRAQMALLIYGPTLPADVKRRFACTSMKFAEARLDMSRTGQECNVAILHGTHTTALELLLTGKPVLHLPLTLDQLLVAENVQRLGAGISMVRAGVDDIVSGVRRLLNAEYLSAAAAFASRYRGTNPDAQTEVLIEQLSADSPRRGSGRVALSD